MRKLGGIEKVEDFILAIANGADVNGNYNGEILIGRHFTECMRQFQINFDRRDEDFEKLKALVTAGANIIPLFYPIDPMFPKGAYNCKNLINQLVYKLKLLEVVLNSAQIGEITRTDKELRNGLKSLRMTMKNVEAVI